MPIKLYILPLLALLLAGCTSRHAAVEEAGPKVIDRLDLALDSVSPEQCRALDAWLEVIGRSEEEYISSEAVRVFTPMVRERIPDLDSVERVLGHALPASDSIRLVAVVSPFNQSVVTHPAGYVFIALNHYLGANHPAYAGRFAAYERHRKGLHRLPADVVEALVARTHPAGYAPDATLLNNMLYCGALLQTVLESMPEGTPERTVLGMTADGYEYCTRFEANIWQTLIEKQLLYSSDPILIQRLLSPAPFSGLISSSAPGQAALYVAMKIVQSYLRNHPGVSAESLLVPDFYNSNRSLIDSKYSPSNAKL